MASRRTVLSSGVLAGLSAACVRSSQEPLRGELLGRHRAELAHRLWVPWERPRGEVPARANVVVVGAGVAGLAACWRLVAAGVDDVLLIELDEVVGGTSQAGTSTEGVTAGQRFALGAHYVTLPNPENKLMRRLFAELGIIESFDGDGRPRYAQGHLCLAPQERIFVAGKWSKGLWPADLASPADEAQRVSWEAMVDDWTYRVGDDGRPAFSIPLALASQDPKVRALADVSFADWLDHQGLDSPLLRWILEYATRDDFGTTLQHTSAWAGLHYHCARRPDPSDDRDLGTHVLTWPAGNGRLTEALSDLVSKRVRVQTGMLVQQVSADGYVAGSRRRGGEFEVHGEHVVLAVPTPIADRLLGHAARPTPTAAPWRVGVLHCSAPPASHGVPLAWDSVVYGTPDLGAISNAHQLGVFGGPTVLTWYEPLTGDPGKGRRDLLTASWEAEADHVMSALSPAHMDLRATVERLDIWHWGHGTVRPTVGLHSGQQLARLRTPNGVVHRAHTDLSGLSLFEEALWHGVRAAEEILDTDTWR